MHTALEFLHYLHSVNRKLLPAPPSETQNNFLISQPSSFSGYTKAECILNQSMQDFSPENMSRGLRSTTHKPSAWMPTAVSSPAALPLLHTKVNAEEPKFASIPNWAVVSDSGFD